MNDLKNVEKVALYSFKENLICKKIEKIGVLAKKSTAYLDYLQYCKEILFNSLNSGINPFISVNERVVELYELCQESTVEEERKQLFEQDMNLWDRLFKYLYSSGYKYLSDYSYVTDIDDAQVKTKCYILKKNDKFIFAKIKAGKPKLSYKARKFENKLDNDFDLLSMVREAQLIFPEFPEKDIDCSLFYLKGKDDTSSELEEYELKDGHNILTIQAAKYQSVTYEYLTKVAQDYKELYSIKDNCKECEYEFFCSLKNHSKLENKQEEVKNTEEPIEHEEEVVTLSEAQECIVSKGTGNFLVSAVPGAGKTRILIERVKKLLSKGVSPKKIMLITFTNEAMKEIKKRLLNVKGGNMVHVTTFNKFGHNILTKHYIELGYELPPVIVTKYESYLYLIDIIKELKIEVNMKYLFKEFALMKKLYSAVMSSKEVNENSKLPEEILENLDLIKELFNKKLLQDSLITYDMQITEAIKLLKQNMILRLSYVAMHDFIMVDEYQDSDNKNAELVGLVANDNVMVVGDEDQSIYGFKGANIENFLNFEGEKYFMTENYRSSNSVINVANTIISKNLQRLDSNKRIFPKLDIQGDVRYIPGGKCIDKIPFIVKDLLNQEYRLDDIAVIARTHKLLEGAYEELSMKGINTVYGAKNLVETFEFEILYHFLNAYVNAESNSLMIICSYLKDLDENADINTPYEDIFKDLSKDIDTEVFSEVIDNISALLGNKEHIIYKILKENCVTYGIYSLSKLYKYLYGLKLTEDNITIPVVNDNGVSLLTAHAAKGREYRAVIILKTEKFEAKTEDELEEERRLLYVAFTRAKEQLYITYEKVGGLLNELGLGEYVAVQ